MPAGNLLENTDVLCNGQTRFVEFDKVGCVAVLLHLLIVWTWASNLTSHSQYLCGKQTIQKNLKERKNTTTITKVFKDLQVYQPGFSRKTEPRGYVYTHIYKEINIRNWLMLWRLTGTKICSWQTGDPREVMVQVQSEGWLPETQEKPIFQCESEGRKKEKDDAPARRQSDGRNSFLTHRRVNLFALFRYSADCRRPTHCGA